MSPIDPSNPIDPGSPIGRVGTAEHAAGWERALQVDAASTGDTASAGDTATAGETLVQVRHTLTSRLRDAYPVGARDLEIGVTRGTPEGVALVVAHLFAEDPACRRIILAVPEQDRVLADLAEGADLRPVVEVELTDDTVVELWVAEPARVTARSTAVDDLPQT
ncbi:hypothetical protein [Raineyella sp.]|uniref:hypothetical protein n=1 Tax=Raineyella sp. TaxID=1911550 RepID=UPI002B20E51F|nr:hypothetical protein [Raineyella sp.]MEA5154913.1 hypothetical protein [Raineyella sp.]